MAHPLSHRTHGPRKKPSAAREGPPAGVRPPWSFWALLLLFAASGFSALVYEIVWFQLLEFVVGVTAISLGILLAIFMGGLCIGSLLSPAIGTVQRHPLRTYALLELGIGALALVVLYEVPWIGHLYTGSGSHGLWGILLRAAIAGLCLLPPTVLMGAGLPAVARWVEADHEGVGWLGRLYASNIAGAIVGCLLAGFYLLRVHDMATATYVAAAVNVGVFAVAFLLARWVPSLDRPQQPAPSPAPRIGWRTGVVYAVVALSGLCALGAEVVWTRVLALLLGATVYTFSIILAVFLFGLALGGAAGAALARTSPRPGRDLAVCQMLLVAAVAWAAFMIDRSLPYWPVLPSLTTSPWISFQLDIARCLWAVLPAAVLWGASFPLGLAAAAGRGQDPGRLVAGIYVANTVGAVVGALAFTFWIVPAFGPRAAQQVMMALSCAGGLLLLPAAFGRPSGMRRLVPAAALAVAAVALTGELAATAPPVPPELIAHGRTLAFRLGARDPRTNAPVATPPILYSGVGINESVAVSGNDRVRLFHVSGKTEASTSRKDMRLQRMLGEIPALVHPNPRSVLVVGFGAGVTAGSFVPYPTVERIVVCELEPLIPRVISRYFRDANYDVVDDPRVRIVYDDARHYMLTTREKFDVITSDPIHPWVKGSAALYSREYFDLMRRHLNPGGVVSQWVPLYQSSEGTIRSELATFFASFPHGSVWANTDRGKGYDLVLLGGADSYAFRLDLINQRLRTPAYSEVVRSLAGVGFGSVPDLLSTYAGRHRDLAPWLEGAVINRDRNLRLQYQAGLETFVEDEDRIYKHLLAYRRFPDDLFVGPEDLKQALRAGGEPPG